LHVFSGHNRRHKSVTRAQKRAAKILRQMWKARLGSRGKVLLICSLSDMMGNTYDVVLVYDVVYDIVCDITYDIVCEIVYDIVKSRIFQFHLDCVVQRYSRRSRAYDWKWQSFDRVVQSHFV
jgi:hypothetical protein